MGTRFWNCVGRCSQVHSEDEYGPRLFLENSLQLGTYAKQHSSSCKPCCSGVTPLETSEPRRPRHLEMERVQMMTGMQVDSLKKGQRKGKGKNQHHRGNRTTSTTNTSSTDINTCKNCGKPGHWTKDCWNLGGGSYDNSTYRKTGKGKSKTHR